MELTEKQKEIFELARAKLEKKPWFKGVCLDDFPTDDEIEILGKEECVSIVVDETTLWDAPGSLAWL